jgi:hypothetical protein
LKLTLRGSPSATPRKALTALMGIDVRLKIANVVANTAKKAKCSGRPLRGSPSICLKSEDVKNQVWLKAIEF